ncbi:1,4-dihydroxy-2-naphthoate octaprenyltransferase [Azonexus sp.]|uniref:1,4-dihydroxy-2-naphthoate octaprenyltransferase n=1 Tax=Azonexus sp. TaxID=1872668 RepID=UPI0035AE696B
MNRIDTAWRPSTCFVWWTAIRPRTLGMSVAPVAFGTALALADGGGLDWAVLAATLACALLIQIGTNLYNDAADYERGTDTPDRRGPTRVTLAGWASAGSVKRGAALCLGVALAIGAGLVAVGGWPILAIGCASLVAAWGYSGGPRPISHTPLGEVFVLAFFGVFAVAGSHWLQSPQLSWRDLVGGLAVGAPAAAVLLVNNFRDLDTDRRSGRRTLAAVLGPRRTRFAYAAFVLAPFAAFAALAAGGLLGAVAGALCLPACVALIPRLEPTAGAAELNRLLAATARLATLGGLLGAAGIALGRLLF